MYTIMSVIQVGIAVLLVFLVLLHSGKDAGLSGAFGIGGGGSSMFSPGLASRLFELILIDPDTHWKNFAISPGARVFIIRTHSVTRFNCSVSFSAPHMHAMMFAILADFSSVTA